MLSITSENPAPSFNFDQHECINLTLIIFHVKEARHPHQLLSNFTLLLSFRTAHVLVKDWSKLRV